MSSFDISVTASARAHIDRTVSRAEAKFFRLHVKSSGCSGYRYAPEVVSEARNGDLLVSLSDDWQLLVSEQAIPLVNGTTIDYVEKGISHQLIFQNPNAEDECGCGESFSVPGKEGEAS